MAARRVAALVAILLVAWPYQHTAEHREAREAVLLDTAFAQYVGAARYMRDEVGPQGVHVRGAVGMSTRGGDTGDGQFFIDLVDLPRLDRDYTVFAYVTSGMDLVDKMLEGAKIVRISVR